MSTIINTGSMSVGSQNIINTALPQRAPVRESLRHTAGLQPQSALPASAKDVMQNFEAARTAAENSVRELQQLSDIITRNRLKFSVNTDLNKVIVTVVDANTNEVVRQIPSEDLQRISERMRHTIGVLFDEMI